MHKALAPIAAALVAALLLGGACNQTPVSNLEKSFTLKVESNTGDNDPVKIDFLWVVDNSTSMCQEQAGLARSFQTFTDTLEQSFTVDAHIAVTSVAAQCENNGTTVFSGHGVFNTHPSHTLPVACGESVRMPCEGAGSFCNDGLDCSELGECDTNGKWSCQQRQTVPTCVQNPNGTSKEYCRRTCANDAECQELFNDTSLKCVIPGTGQLETTACVREPPTADCPDELPAVLVKNAEVDNSNLFPCIATVGLASGSSCFRYEEQLRSALLAIDPTGPNHDQSVEFLRDDAYLVIIVVSDEEDCSVADGRENMISEATGGPTVFDRCGLLKTTDDGGPLVPVAHFVNRFKSLKTDPSRVIVATIAGDSLASDEAQKQAERDAYVSSKSEPQDCRSGTYICDSANGTADYGRRLIEFADAFGPNGTFQNICGDEGIGFALTRIADSIVSVINRICLPKPILGGLSVSRTRNGVTTQLTEGEGPGTFHTVLGAEDCVVDGVQLPAITFADRPQPGDAINVVYQGDPQLP